MTLSHWKRPKLHLKVQRQIESRGLSATAELLVLMVYIVARVPVNFVPVDSVPAAGTERINPPLMRVFCRVKNVATRVR